MNINIIIATHIFTEVSIYYSPTVNNFVYPRSQLALHPDLVAYTRYMKRAARRFLEEYPIT